MADKRILMELLNMFAGSMRNIGQQRQQGSQFRAGMRMNKAQLDQQKDLAMKRLDQEAKALASLNRLRASQIKAYNIDIEIGELGMAKEAKEKEARTIMGAEAGLEGESPYRTPEQWTEHPGIQEAGLGGTVLGMGQEIKGQAPDYGGMMEAINYSIATGATLPAHLNQAQGYVEKQRELTNLLETNAITRAEYELESLKAESQWNAFRAENPWAFVPRYGSSGLGAGMGTTAPPVPPGVDVVNQIKYLQETSDIDPQAAAEQVYNDIIASFTTQTELYQYLNETWGLELGEGFAYSPGGLKQLVIDAILAKAGIKGEMVRTTPQEKITPIEGPAGTAFRGKPGRGV